MSFQANYFILWSFAALVCHLVFGLRFENFILPLIVVVSLALLLKRYHVKHIEYLLFFSISVTSLFGLSKTLNGFHAESTNIFLFGLSFYSASMAYLISKNNFHPTNVLTISNPLLLVTGPIALFLESISHKSLILRFKYYFPFIIIGIFMFQVVANPLTEFFFLIEKTDAVSSIFFAGIFELFVYMNFCGLSLLIYGIFGLIGYKIPLNFKQPFSSNNIIEFWRGWHTSLSEVLKVLFYKPLRASFSPIIALIGVFVSSAIWHGVSFNFLIWGIFHALFFWVSISLLKKNYVFLSLLLTPFIIVIGRLIFVDTDTNRLLEKLSFSYRGFDIDTIFLNAPTHSQLALVFGFLIISIEFAFRNSRIMQKRNYKFLRTPFSLMILSIIGIVFVSNVGIDYAVYGQR